MAAVAASGAVGALALGAAAATLLFYKYRRARGRLRTKIRPAGGGSTGNHAAEANALADGEIGGYQLGDRYRASSPHERGAAAQPAFEETHNPRTPFLR